MIDPDRHVRPFGDWLHEQRSGALAAELAHALCDLVEAVQQHGKAGSLTLVVKVAPAGKNGLTVVVSDDVKVKAPEGDRGDSIFFVGPDGNLSRDDFRQPALPLRGIDSLGEDEVRPVREVQR